VYTNPKYRGISVKKIPGQKEAKHDPDNLEAGKKRHETLQKKKKRRSRVRRKACPVQRDRGGTKTEVTKTPENKSSETTSLRGIKKKNYIEHLKKKKKKNRKQMGTGGREN